MALKMILEGTPASFPVQPFNASAPVYWEAGMFGSIDANGNVAVVGAPGTSGVIGLLADRRNTTVGIANANYLPSMPGKYGDETFFNQPGMGNTLYGITADGFGGTTPNVIPTNSIPTTTLLRDETAQNVNVDSRYVTVYIRGGVYATDQFDTSVAAAVPGNQLFVNSIGRLTTANPGGGVPGVAVCHKAVDGNGLLTFKLEIV
jgi:hypothetical protein